MTIQLRWLASESASCFHAVAALSRNLPLADARVAAALADWIDPLLDSLAAVGLPADRCWQHLLPLCPEVHNNRTLAERILNKLLGPNDRSDSAESRLAGNFSDLESAFRRAVPRVVEELELRSRPIREAWEARGPGLLATVGRLTEPALLVEQADVVLVHPSLGGAGAAHLLYNSVRLEAVLANPQASLPEVARLAWLLSQLHLDLPRYTENLPRDHVPTIAALAMLPVILTAAEQVELARCDQQTLELAITTWDVGANGGASPEGFGAAGEIASALLDWWGTFRESRPRINVGLAALDQMLFPALR